MLHNLLQQHVTQFGFSFPKIKSGKIIHRLLSKVTLEDIKNLDAINTLINLTIINSLLLLKEEV